MSRRQPTPRLRPAQPTGFTLLELLIVLAILGVIAAIVVPNLLGSQQKANIKATEASIKGLEQSLKLYAVDHAGVYPEGNQETLELLTATTDDDGNSIQAALDELPKDAWGNSFFYEYPSTKTTADKPAIWSAGPNQQDEQGGGDDVTNWSTDD